MHLSQICRLCLERTNNETVLVEIFSQFVNEPGKTKLNDKIRSLTGVSIAKNDGLPPKICHKCVVSIDSFYDFKNRVLSSDEKLRQFLNLNGTDEHKENEIDEANVITLDPNKVYESSEEEEEERSYNEEASFDVSRQTEQQPEISTITPQQPKIDKKESNAPAKRPCNASTRDKIEIFHCKYCDVVFSEMESCANHENLNHDKVNPYECTLCPFKASQHQHLIIHIKSEHQTDKPFFCIVCSKSFMRRSDLRKHTFVHSGIRLFSCNICSKSFTRAQNLAKHKRTHSETSQKSHKCSLCPRAFASNGELSSHMDSHMNRNTLNCKYCNQVFTQREELELHQRSHIAQMKATQVQQLQSTPIVFYNQQPNDIAQQSPMNFYKERVDAPRIEHPIINQLLTSFNNALYKCDKCLEQFPTLPLLQSHQSIHHSRNFVCAICSNAYYKKKELDRHVISAHTDIKFNCSKCDKSFSRKDKLTRHERTHLVPAFFNCPLCPAVFVRKHLLDLHSKIHMLPSNNLGPIDGSGAMMVMTLDQPPPLPLPPLIPESVAETFMSAASPSPPPAKQPSPLDLSSVKMSEELPVSAFYPMNLSMNQSLTEPMDLSNEKFDDDADVSIVKIEPPRIVLESDDEDDDLKIIENNEDEQEMKRNAGAVSVPPNIFIPKTENEEMPIATAEPNALINSGALLESAHTATHDADQSEANDVEEELAFKMSSRLADLLEPTKDLPMEILQSPDI